jgi:hypothetical protein
VFKFLGVFVGPKKVAKLLQFILEFIKHLSIALPFLLHQGDAGATVMGFSPPG